jgi:murein L,D-transpeptidase YcbB/YkuD
MTSRVPIPPVAAFLCIFSLAACHRAPRIDNSQHARAIRRIVSNAPSWVGRDPLSMRLWRDERTFYESRDHMPAWMDGVRSTARVGTLVDGLRHADDQGLDPARYGTADLEKEIDVAHENRDRYDAARVPDFDVRLTFAYLRYAADLLGWSGNPTAIYTDWIVTPAKEDLPARLRQAIESGQIRQSLEQLAPSHPQYQGLIQALRRQREHPDGHIDQIVMNIERWRWTPRDLGDRYVMVNVPAYQMQVVEGGTPVLAMRAIVGEPKTPTPLFSDEMTGIVFSPSWNVPETIIRKEMVPKLVDDPDYLTRQDIDIIGTSGDVVDASDVDWTDPDAVTGLHFKQAPGPGDALGLIKFVFPNRFDVYMHDTPTRALFNKPRRAMSHGCVRLENPTGLAQYVLRDQPQWTIEKISAAMNAGQEQAVRLKQHLPVHIVYFTAWVNPDGSVKYTDDPYGLDARQVATESERMR